MNDSSIRSKLLTEAALEWLVRLSIGGFVLGVAGPALAQTSPANQHGGPAATLGEVVVTARKRSESLQKVPLSITVNSGQELQRQGIRSVGDIEKIVPGLSTLKGVSMPSGVAFDLRGQEPGDFTLTISNAVGVYVDSGNVPHPVGLQGALLDVDRMEVLKGPQGTLYGRNTTGGAINIITRGADYKGVHGSIFGELGDFNDRRFGASLNLPLMQDVLAIRLVYQRWQRDGFGESLATGQRAGDDRNDHNARLSVRFDPTKNVSSQTKVEYFNIARNGYFYKDSEFYPNTPAGLPASYTPTVLAPLTQAIQSAGYETQYRNTGNPFYFVPAAGGVTPAQALALGTTALQQEVANTNIFQNYSRDMTFDRLTTWHVVEDWTWNLTDQMALRSITSYHSVLDHVNTNLAGSGFTILQIDQAPVPNPFAASLASEGVTVPPSPALADLHQWTQEFDLSGTAGDLKWLAGAFGSWENGAGGDRTLGNTFNPSAGTFASLVQGANGRYQTDSWAIYTQDEYHVTQALSFTLGGRYTEESQQMTSQTWLANPELPLAPPPFGPLPPFICLSNTSFVNNPDNCPTTSGSLKSHGLSYLASINYQVTPDILMYFKTARGYRGGALQYRDPSQPAALPETATDYEFGFKSTMLERRLRLNMAAYQTDYANKQVLTLVPVGLTVSSLIQNAAQARIRGVEADFQAAPMSGLSVYGTLGYLQGEYLQYKNPVSLLADSVPLCQRLYGLGSCTLTNIPFSNPNWQYSIGGRYEHEAGPGTLGAQVDWSWHGKTNSTILDTSLIESAALQNRVNAAVGLMNARIDYNIPDTQLNVAFFVTNALDKHYVAAGLPAGFFGVTSVLPQAPRMWGVTITKKFGAE